MKIPVKVIKPKNLQLKDVLVKDLLFRPIGMVDSIFKRPVFEIKEIDLLDKYILNEITRG